MRKKLGDATDSMDSYGQGKLRDSTDSMTRISEVQQNSMSHGRGNSEIQQIPRERNSEMQQIPWTHMDKETQRFNRFHEKEAQSCLCTTDSMSHGQETQRYLLGNTFHVTWTRNSKISVPQHIPCHMYFKFKDTCTKASLCAKQFPCLVCKKFKASFAKPI
jgi:hypothetical protein